jgi:hypothetical protein
LLWGLYNVVICYFGWTFWEVESYNKLPGGMTILEPWEWWMRVIGVWGLANVSFAVGPLLELVLRRWCQRTLVTRGVFFFLILVVSVVLITDWASHFKTDYLRAGESVSWANAGLITCN